MKKGFTLIELMVVVVIIGILAAIAIPNFIAMQERAKQASVKGNMHTTQLCVESYAVDFNGAYPSNLNAPGEGFGYYFPGGNEDVQSIMGRLPTNPYTGRPMEVGHFLIHTYAMAGQNSDKTIAGPNDANLGNAGFIRYGRFAPGGTWPWTEWGIVGSRKDYQTIRGGVTIHVLHN